MKKLLTLREAGIPYPDMSALTAAAKRLGAESGFHVLISGGYLRDLVLRGNTQGVQDLDISMPIRDFLALKPLDSLDEDVRRQFVLHQPHLLYMTHLIADGKFNTTEKPLVLDLAPSFVPGWNLGIPIGLTLTRKPIEARKLIMNVDLGFCSIVSNGREIWVTHDFLRDRRQKTMTLTRCRNPTDYDRTLRRVERFKLRYPGWQFVVPPKYREYLKLAA